MKKNIILAVAIILALSFCFAGFIYYNFLSQKETKNIISKAAASQILDFKNSIYVIDGRKIKLVNGDDYSPMYSNSSYDSEAPITKYFGNEAFGDLNGDGKKDVAFLLTQTTSGTGTFFYVVADLSDASGEQGTNAIFLGDRIAPQTTEINNGVITVNYADRKPTEPFSTQPSMGVSRYFRIVSGSLVEIK
jgi:hypothetical protein